MQRVVTGGHLSRTDEARSELARRVLSRRHLRYFTQYVTPWYEFSPFHESYIRVLSYWLTGKIKRLAVSVPAQHGKSQISSRILPARILAENPGESVAIASYAFERARRFGKDIKRIWETAEFRTLYPWFILPSVKESAYTNTADIVEIPCPPIFGGRGPGRLLLTGRGGALTGEPVDTLIVDDIYKNRQEALSPLIRKTVIDWYDTVAETRLHNRSRQLFVNTRWHEDDLIGHLMRTTPSINLVNWSQLDNPDPDALYVLNFPALQTERTGDIDAREPGEPLFASRHSAAKLLATRDRLLLTEPETWETLYQGNPRPLTGLLYMVDFKTWDTLPEALGEKRCFIDIADTGKDNLCAVVYASAPDGFIYVLDVYHTPEPQEVTERAVADMLIRNKVSSFDCESNAGGRAFARNVARLCLEAGYPIEYNAFNRRANKEARILNRSGDVLRLILMPLNWAGKFPLFYKEIRSFKRLFAANAHDDAADTLTSVVECADGSSGEVYVGAAQW